MLSESNIKQVEELRKRYPTAPALVLPVLWMVQEEHGYISEEAMKYVAQLLKLPFGHILGVVTFYTMYHAKPIGKHHIEVCTNVSCMLRGSDKIMRHLQEKLRIGVGETSPDKKWTISEVECMGSCGTAPMFAIGEEYYENLTQERVDKILGDLVVTTSDIGPENAKQPQAQTIQKPASIRGISSWEPVIIPDIKDFHKIDVYQSQGGYKSLQKALEMKPEDVVEEVKRSGLRGRGGACFPTGLKWSFMPKQTAKQKYLCINGDESEPGTFKDRAIFEFNPHQMIEGTLIACYAMGISTAYIYIRGEYGKWIRMVEKALADAYERNLVGENILGTSFSTNIYVHKGAGAYICGEESALMNSIEGERGYPRVKPPFPAQYGLWGCPTTINNVETIANVPLIIKNGADWYSKIGAPKHPGPILVGVSGHVNQPGVYEMPTGELLLNIIYKYAGGVPGDKGVKAVIPGGSSTMILRGDQLEGVRMDADSMKPAGSAVGTAGMIVMDTDTDLIRVITRIAKFYYHESCGQCTPCREGTGWLWKLLKRFETGEAKLSDIDLLMDIANNIEGNTICALGDAAAWPVQSMIRRFRDEFERRVSKEPESVSEEPALT